jgi:hypothetical protein
MAESEANLFQTEPTGGAAVTVTSISSCPGEVTATYAGVTITYETNNNILRFNSASDFDAVVNQLDLDYENYNDTHDNSYDPNLTVDQMDSIDDATGFDEFYPFKAFENLFSGLVTKRMQFESLENTWLSNDFSGTDPDDGDLTYDDAENTVFNENYSFKIGTSVYQLTSTGLYINGVLQASVNGFSRVGDGSMAAISTIPTDPFGILPGNLAVPSGPSIATDISPIEEMMAPGCKSNKKDKGMIPFGDNERYKIKIAVNSTGIRASAKGKVVHFKKKNGHWKRKRAKMAVFAGGTVYNNQCDESFQFSDRKPSPNGWKKRRQLKTVRRQYGAIWRTYSGLMVASFDTEVGHSGGITLTF